MFVEVKSLGRLRERALKVSGYFLLSVMIAFDVFADESLIRVDPGKEIGPVNKLVFGINLLGCCSRNSSDYGYGIWDSKWNNASKEPMELLRGAGISVLRFPGGADSSYYDWRNARDKGRKEFLYGLEEFLKTCDLSGAQPVFTVSYFKGDEKDAADLVKYFNYGKDGGREQRVKYFEIGNETYHEKYGLTPRNYADRYLDYYTAMRQADQDIKIGIVLWNDSWNKTVLGMIKDKVDFGILHIYPTPVWGDRLSGMSSREIFAISWAKPITEVELGLKRISRLLKESSGKNIALAVTEFNGGFVQDKPVPYRHCLGNAILNAELLRVFMKPVNNVLMANYWNFCNEYWGMISNGFDGTQKGLYAQYYKRPNYYVFEMYKRHFGDVLFETEVKCDTYDIRMYQPFYKELIKRFLSGTVIKPNLLSREWEINRFDGVEAEEENGILRIDFNTPQKFNYYHCLKRADIRAETYYKLSGYIKTEDLVDGRGVCLEIQDARGWDATRSSAATDEISGTTGWEYVEAIYETLPDAASVNVIARRIGENGPLKGRAYFRDVKLEKFVPDLDARRIPYLSVNASKSADGNKVYLMVINKNMNEDITADIELKDFMPAVDGNAWILNGPSVEATNEENHDNVRVVHRDFKAGNLKSGEKNSFKFTFEKHSLTAIELVRARGKT